MTVCYLEEKPELDFGPFMSEEVDLLESISGLISVAIQSQEVLDNLTEQEAATNSAIDAIIGIDLEGSVTMANPAAVAMFGFDSEQRLLGTNISSVMPPRYRDRHSQGLARIRSGGPLNILGAPVEVAVLTRDGSEIPVEITINKLRNGNKTRYVGVLRDISERKAEEQQRRLADTAIRSTADMVVITDPTGIIEFVNHSFELETGYQSAEVIGKSTSLLKSGRQDARYYESLWSTVARGDVRTGQLINKRKDGSEYDEEMSITPIRDSDEIVTNYVAIKRNISERIKREAELVTLATTDTLTGLNNRHQFNTQLEQTRLLSLRNKRHSSLLLIDIDSFKFVNDTYGHTAGDTVLVELGKVLRSSVRASDFVARVGGDEFAIILNETGNEDAHTKALQIISSVDNLVVPISGHDVSIGISIGISELSQSQDHDDVVARADIALYQSKDAGRGTATVYDPDSDAREQMSQAQSISNILRAGDLEDKLILYSQPIQPIQEGLPEIREVLSRLEGPDGNLIQPAQFLPQAEAIDLMDDVDRQVLESTFRFLSTEKNMNTLTSINVSGRFVTPENARWIIETAKAHKVNTTNIIIEITETALAREVDSIAEFLSILKTADMKLAMDDFGAGVTTFHHLRDIEFDYLKLDGAIIRDAGHNKRDRDLIWGLAGLARTLGLTVIAEFVQDQETVQFLGEAGVGYAQGYFIGKPEPLKQ